MNSLQCSAILGFIIEQVPKLGRLSFESLAKNNNKSRIVSILVGTIAASVLLGVYHYAYSPPLNQRSMVLFLMLPSIATAVTYFLGRDIYVAVILQNFKGIVVAFPHHNSVGVVVVLASLSSNFFLLVIGGPTPLLPVQPFVRI